MTTTDKLHVIIEADDKASGVFKKIWNQAKKTFWKLQSTGEKLKSSFGGVALAAWWIWIAWIKMSMDFSKSMSNISTLVDTSKESMSKMKKEVLDLAGKTPVALSDLSSALYDVRSAWVDASKAMWVLENSAKLSVAWLGSVSEATDLMTSAFNSFSKQGYNSNQIANILFKTVKNGKTTIAQLSQWFWWLAGLASWLWVDFRQLMWATAALTTSWMSASESYTWLKAILSNILKPWSDAKKMAKKLWIDFSVAWLKAKWFAWFLQEVKEKTHWNKVEMAKLFGSVEWLNAVIALTWPNAKAFANTMADMKTKANWLDEAYKKQNQTFWATYNILKNKLQVAMIQIWATITPILQKIINWTNKNPELTKTILKIAWVVIWLTAILWTLWIAITWITTVVGGLWVALTVLTWPVWIAIWIIWGLIYIWYQLKTHWTELSNYTALVWNNIKTSISNTVETIKLTLIAVWDIIKYSIIWKYYDIYNEWLKIFWAVKSSIIKAFDGVKKPILAVMNWVKWKIDWIMNKINSAKRAIWWAISKAGNIARKATHFIGSKISSWWNTVKNFAGFRANGWPVQTGKTYIVWERGPEYFTPKTSWTIIPNGATSWVNININMGGVVVNNEADENRLVEKIKYALSRDLQYANLWIN